MSEHGLVKIHDVLSSFSLKKRYCLVFSALQSEIIEKNQQFLYIFVAFGIPSQYKLI